jgi:hypothetical protein
VADRGVYILPRTLAAQKQAIPVTWPTPPTSNFPFDFPPVTYGWSRPKGLWVNASSKDIYVADNRNLVKVSGATNYATFIGGYDQWFQFDLADVFGDDKGTLWVTNSEYATVKRVTDGGTTISDFTISGYSFVRPYSVTVSNAGVV